LKEVQNALGDIKGNTGIIRYEGEEEERMKISGGKTYWNHLLCISTDKYITANIKDGIENESGRLKLIRGLKNNGNFLLLIKSGHVVGDLETDLTPIVNQCTVDLGLGLLGPTHIEVYERTHKDISDKMIEGALDYEYQWGM
jgi:hypothetical protein